MEVRRICQWCGKPFIAQTTTLYCSHHCANLGYKERMKEFAPKTISTLPKLHF